MDGQTDVRMDRRTDGRMDRQTDGWTDRRGSRNSYLDLAKCLDQPFAMQIGKWIIQRFG